MSILSSILAVFCFYVVWLLLYFYSRVSQAALNTPLIYGLLWKVWMVRVREEVQT
jgi:hypothetical protein